MRRHVAVLLFLALPLRALSVGSTQPGAAPDGVSGLTGASSRNGHLAVWIGKNGDLDAVRIDNDGRPVDEQPLVLGKQPWFNGPILVASDGEDYLVVWSEPWENANGAPVEVAHVSGSEGTVSHATLPISSSSFLTALASDGKHYFLLTRTSGLLLDRDGAVTSGGIFLGGTRCSAAGERGRWFMVCDGMSGRVMLDDASFPPAGTNASIALPHGEPWNVIDTGVDARGFYSVRQSGLTLSFQRYTHSGAPIANERTLVTLPSDHPSELHAFSDGSRFYVSYKDRYVGAPAPAAFVVVRRGRLEVLPFADSAVPSYDVSILGNAAGPLLLWSDTRDGAPEAYVAQPDRLTDWLNGGILVSRALAEQDRPALTCTPSACLAIWRERAAAVSLQYQLFRRDGSAIMPAQTLVTTDFEWAEAATDGTSFLVAWTKALDAGGSAPVRVQAIDRWGGRPTPSQVAGEGVRIGSFFWDGAAYVLTTDEGEPARLAADGTTIERALWSDHDMLLIDVDRTTSGTRRYVGMAAEIESSVLSAGPQLFLHLTPIVLDEHLLEAGGSSNRLDLAWDEATLPAVAANGGEVFAVTRFEDSWERADHPYRAYAGEWIGFDARHPRVWGARMHAERLEDGWIVDLGTTLQRFDRTGHPTRAIALGDDIRDVAFAVDGMNAIVLEERSENGTPRLAIRRVPLSAEP